jgi:hypothetical protein
MLKGTYVFKQNGVEVGRSNNIITTNGQNAILQYISGNSSDWASSIAVGVMNATPTVNDLNLQYEIARSSVTLKSYKIGTPNLIIVKGVIDASVSANIYEVGVYPYNTDKIFGKRDKLVLTDFSIPTDWTAVVGAFSSTPFAAQQSLSPRVGLYNINIENQSIITNTGFMADLSSYSPLDTLDILANVDSAKTGTLIVTLTDVNGISTILTYSFDGSVKSGYQVLSQNFDPTIYSLQSVKTITVQTVGANSDISLDAIRISLLGEVSSTSALVSRSILTTPIAKIFNVPLDIEYYLELG